MNEEVAAQERSGETGPYAAALALGSASREKADVFLDRQATLAELQAEELRRDLGLHHWSMRVQHVSGILKLAFEFALAIIFLGVVVLIGGAVWNAAHDNGAVIEAFSVPPDFVAKGLTGEVVASRILDRLNEMQAQTHSARAASSYGRNWGDNIKVQIPDTGISIGEFNRYLHEWLGSETRISGQVYRTATGLAVAARANGVATPVFQGKDQNLDALVDRTAGAVYRITQPYRYAIYLYTHDQRRIQWTTEDTEADAVMNELIDSGTAEDRAWALDGMGSHWRNFGNFEGAIPLYRRAIAAGAGQDAYDDLASVEQLLRHPGEELKVRLEEDAVASRGGATNLDRLAARTYTVRNKRDIAALEGDFLAAQGFAAELHMLSAISFSIGYGDDFIECASLHDAGCASRVEAAHSIPPPYRNLGDVLLHHYKVAAEESAAAHAWLASMGTFGAALLPRFETTTRALIAAGLADFKSARALIATTPGDCYDCVDARATIEARAGNWNGAAQFFARAIGQAPSIPFAYSDWGEMLLRKGDIGGAIAKFAIAHAKGPHFADPLELWGEALMQENRSDLALAKFEEANGYAPNWGRLHLKWGEALLYAGKRDDARHQFAIASHLDLSATDAAALKHMRAQHV